MRQGVGPCWHWRVHRVVARHPDVVGGRRLQRRLDPRELLARARLHRVRLAADHLARRLVHVRHPAERHRVDHDHLRRHARRRPVEGVPVVRECPPRLVVRVGDLRAHVAVVVVVAGERVPRQVERVLGVALFERVDEALRVVVAVDAGAVEVVADRHHELRAQVRRDRRHALAVGDLRRRRRRRVGGAAPVAEDEEGARRRSAFADAARLSGRRRAVAGARARARTAVGEAQFFVGTCGAGRLWPSQHQQTSASGGASDGGAKPRAAARRSIGESDERSERSDGDANLQ